MDTKHKSGNKSNPSNSAKRPNGRSENSKQNGDILYPQESESQPQREGADATFSERNDVTPPNRKEPPSLGPSKTDFESRPQGRTTGRMVSHEPGTEGR
ncbi:MAG: hypothetical protein JST19_10330 [Bacteroidetes bacterium]|nr:hypothetical protein [Bacteroidota bacterium]